VAETLCPVVANDWVNDAYKHLILDAAHGAARAEPGQFFHLLCPTTGENAPFFRRPMSIYRIDKAQGRIEFLYKIVGRGTTTLAALAPGETLNIFGPLGRQFDFGTRYRHIVQVARGVGLATLAPVAEAAGKRGESVDEQQLELAKQMIELKIDQESSPFFATARLWDDGLIDPRQTRSVIAIALSAAHSAKVRGTTEWGVFRH